MNEVWQVVYVPESFFDVVVEKQTLNVAVPH